MSIISFPPTIIITVISFLFRASEVCSCLALFFLLCLNVPLYVINSGEITFCGIRTDNIDKCSV